MVSVSAALFPAQTFMIPEAFEVLDIALSVAPGELTEQNRHWVFTTGLVFNYQVLCFQLNKNYLSGRFYFLHQDMKLLTTACRLR